MKKITALIAEHTDNETVVQSAIQLAKLFQLEISIYHLVEAPHNWELLGKSIRNSHPIAKQKINEARTRMDDFLRIIRAEDIRAQKQFLFYDKQADKGSEDSDPHALVIAENTLFDTGGNEQLLNFLCDFTPSKLIVSSNFSIDELSDIVLSSDFHTIMPKTLQILDHFYAKMEFSLNLVFINTKNDQENSEISIENMKRTIAENGFRKTSISIFNAECRLTGAERFANIKGGDLIITEEKCNANISVLDESHLPMLIINK